MGRITVGFKYYWSSCKKGPTNQKAPRVTAMGAQKKLTCITNAVIVKKCDKSIRISKWGTQKLNHPQDKSRIRGKAIKKEKRIFTLTQE